MSIESAYERAEKIMDKLPATKVCSMCGKERILAEYYRHASSRDGLGYNCRLCTKARVKEYQAQHREKMYEAKKKWREKNREAFIAIQRRSYRNNKHKYVYTSKRYREEHAEERRAYQREAYRRDPEKIKAIKLKSRLKKLKQAISFKELFNFHILRRWPYSNPEKDAITQDIMTLSEPGGSFLSMPHFGRELSIMKGHFNPDLSVGVERDTKIFNSIFKPFRKLFPGIQLVKADINDYAMDKEFDLAHLDYNGPITGKALDAIDSLMQRGQVFVTFQSQFRYGMDDFFSLEELQELYPIIYTREYRGIKGIPMTTIGIAS